MTELMRKPISHFGLNRGRDILISTLKNTEYEYKIDHCLAVGDLGYDIATAIITIHPELEYNINPEVVRFIGYVHDIGYINRAEDHEVETCNILVNRYNIDYDIARKTMHGHLAEKYAIDGKPNPNYLPIGLEGIILTYCDISVDTDGDNISIESRISDILRRLKSGDIDTEKVAEIESYIMSAYPRFLRYEKIILNLLFEEG